MFIKIEFFASLVSVLVEVPIINLFSFKILLIHFKNGTQYHVYFQKRLRCHIYFQNVMYPQNK